MTIKGARRHGKAVLLAAAFCLTAEAASALPPLERDTTPSSSREPQVSPIVIFFEPGSSDIPVSAQQTANRALAESLQARQWQVRVESFAAPEAGKDQEALAEERARNVVAFLVANGIPETRVETGPVRQAERLDPMFGIDGERVEIDFHPDNVPIMADVR